MSTTAKKAASSLPYIGSRISLISKSDIRYEGTLYTIDPTEHTVSLSNVRSFGTEGRRQDGHEVPPSGDIYEYIIFRGSDIKDLRVVSNSQPEEPPKKPESRPEPPKSEVKPDPRPEPQPDNRPERPATEPEIHRERAEYRQPRQERRSPERNLQEDFDFTEANSHLQRSEARSDSAPKAYDHKRSFFDSITSSIGESRRETRDERDCQRTVDSETFGGSNVERVERELRSYAHRNRRGRGRGRGTRRGYRAWYPHS